MISGYTSVHPSCKVISSVEVTDAMYDCIYELYLPRGLFNQLMNLCNYHILQGDYKKALLNSSLFYNSDIINLFHNIDFDFYCLVPQPTSHVVLNILSDLQSTIDFRKIESNIVDTEPDKNCNNVNVMDSDFVEFYTEKDYSNKELNKILDYYTLINNKLFSGKDVNLTKARGRINNMVSMFKTKKSNLVKPLFMYEVLTKSLIVKKETLKGSPDGKTLIYLEDASKSMTKNDGVIVTKAVQKILIETNLPVEYYRYHNDTVEHFSLKTTSDKISAFSTQRKYYTGNCDYSKLLDTVLKDHVSSNIVIVTDGQDYISASIKSDTSIHCVDVSGKTNKSWKRLCKSTNGQYLKL